MMIVGKAVLNMAEVKSQCKDKDSVLSYAKSLVPPEFSHVKGIVDNQVYLVCLNLRKLDSVKWDFKRPLIDSVFRSIKIVGYTDTLIEASTLFNLVSDEQLATYSKKGVKK